MFEDCTTTRSLTSYGAFCAGALCSLVTGSASYTWHRNLHFSFFGYDRGEHVLSLRIFTFLKLSALIMVSIASPYVTSY